MGSMMAVATGTPLFIADKKRSSACKRLGYVQTKLYTVRYSVQLSYVEPIKR